MKRNPLWIAALMVLLAASSNAGDEASRTFTGEIGDSQCALNVHSLTRSHQEMLKSKSMGGDAAECTLYCTRYLGGNFVLVIKDDVYHVDDQIKAHAFAGKRVKITGTLDAKTNTVHILKIEAEP